MQWIARAIAGQLFRGDCQPPSEGTATLERVLLTVLRRMSPPPAFCPLNQGFRWTPWVRRLCRGQ